MIHNYKFKIEIERLQTIASLLEKPRITPQDAYFCGSQDMSMFNALTIQELGEELLKPILEVKIYEGLMPKCLFDDTGNKKDLLDQGAKVFPVEIEFCVSTKKMARMGFPNITTEQQFSPQQYTTPQVVIEDLARIQKAINIQLEYEEDKVLFDIIRKYAKQVSVPDITAEFLRTIAEHGNVLVNGKAFVRRATDSELLLREFDPVGHRELIQSGYIGTLAGTNFICAAAIQNQKLVGENEMILIHKKKEYPVVGIWKEVSPVSIAPTIDCTCGMAAFIIKEKLEYIILDVNKNFTIVDLEK